VPEHPVREDRQCHERQFRLQQPEVERQAQFGDVELVPADQPFEDLRQGRGGFHRAVEAVGGNGPVEQRPRRVVLEAPDLERAVGHGLSLPLLPSASDPLPAAARVSKTISADSIPHGYRVGVAEERHVGGWSRCSGTVTRT
jgi:hypothetical protein